VIQAIEEQNDLLTRFQTALDRMSTTGEALYLQPIALNHWVLAEPSLNPFIPQEKRMNQIIYIVGAIVIVLFILGFLGLR
jgi:hypothetical protein